MTSFFFKEKEQKRNFDITIFLDCLYPKMGKICFLSGQWKNNNFWEFLFIFYFNPSKRGIREKSPTFVQNNFTP